VTSEASASADNGKNLTYRAIAAIAKQLLRAVSTRDWQGTENLPTSGGYVAAANHVTNLDPITFAHYLYDNSRAPRILAKASLWKVPVLKGILNKTKMIPVHRNTSGAAASLADAVMALESGECVAVFPEGTLTRDPDLWPMLGKTGAARLALTSGVPVIPVAQWGAQVILPPYSKKPHLFPRTKVSVHAGQAVDLDDLRNRPMDAGVLKEATDRIMAAITALLEDIRGDKAPQERFDMRKAGREARAEAANNSALPDDAAPTSDPAPLAAADDAEEKLPAAPDTAPEASASDDESEGSHR
jgi:1-acyl-sn-glycerol-3-phosphate acyltransferase